MQKNEIKEEGLKKVRKIIYGRTLVVAAAFLIQFALLLGGFIFLSDYSFALYGFFLIISASVVIYLYNARGIPDFKLVWMLPIIVLPVVGALLYLYFTLQPGTRLIYKRLTDLAEETGKYVIQNPEVKKGSGVQILRLPIWQIICRSMQTLLFTTIPPQNIIPWETISTKISCLS